MLNKFTTKIVSLSTLNNYSFIIPTYQRPYVWGEEQIKKLLDDVLLSFTTNKESIYYISTFLTKEVGDKAELIDGQQRFTTLWLIALVLSEMTSNNSEISTFLKKGDELRLSFEIRDEIKNYLKALLKKESTSKFLNEHFIKKHPYLENIAEALSTIKGYFLQLSEDYNLNEFGNYIYTNVKLVKNTTPTNTDLNKLFTTINSAGIQLEQTDIIKARLLNLIKDEKIKFSRIWESCENMNNYFERNVRQAFPNWKSFNFKKPFDFNDNLFQHNEDVIVTNPKDIFSIDDLLEHDYETVNINTDIKSNQTEEINENEVYCRSIINFSQLLLHIYRIHLFKEGKTDFSEEFHSKNCIAIFNEMIKRNNTEEIKRFFKLLWKVRFVFDIYIIKWVTNIENKTEQLELMNINSNTDGYYSRTKYEPSSNLMLQSMLYFTGDYLRQYWLTPYLNYLLQDFDNVAPTNNSHLEYLEKMDNIISTRGGKSEKELSFEYLKTNEFTQQRLDIEYFNMHLGTGFKHYWFQKLEYILWKNWKDREEKNFKNYRITSRNSVEHIYPQNPENRIQHPEIENKHLHCFGNLVLLSVAQNSEYSNKSVSVKKSMFGEKKHTYDTLKSFYIFQSNQWTPKEIEEHKSEMINLLKMHYEKTFF